MSYLKRIAGLLALSLLMTACSPPQQEAENPVEFYYLRSEIEYGSAQSVIAPEIRDAGNHSGDIRFIMDMYIHGPDSAHLESPFPDGMSLIAVWGMEDCLYVKLNEQLGSLTGMELTLACGCIAKTCFDMTSVSEVRISAEKTLLDGEEYLSFTADSLLLIDDSGS